MKRRHTNDVTGFRNGHRNRNRSTFFKSCQSTNTKAFPPRARRSPASSTGESFKAVKARLKKTGSSFSRSRRGGSVRAGKAREFSFGAGRVRLTDLANATRQLATLLSAGLPLMEALSVLVEQEEKAGLKAALSSVRDSVREGASLADALKANPKAFSQLYVNMVSAGEASGTLEITLDRLADFLEEQVRFRGRLAAALAYPALMTVIGIGVLFFLFSFVLPRVVGMFEDMKQQLPFITLALLGTVKFVSSFWWLIVIVLGGAGYYLRRYFNTPAGGAALDSRLLKLPVFGTLIRMIAVSRFTRTLGTLLQSGVPADGARHRPERHRQYRARRRGAAGEGERARG